MDFLYNELQDHGILLLLTGLDIPILLSFVLAIIKNYRETDKRFNDQEKAHEVLKVELERQLSEYMLKISNEYARLSVVREIERRVVSHLLRIESKLDVTALKAEAANQKSRFNKDH